MFLYTYVFLVNNDTVYHTTKLSSHQYQSSLNSILTKATCNLSQPSWKAINIEHLKLKSWCPKVFSQKKQEKKKKKKDKIKKITTNKMSLKC